MVVTNEKDKKIAFFEVKWSTVEEKEVSRMTKKLKEVSKEVDWFNDKRTEYFGVIVKEVENKEKLKKDGYFVFDLKDLTN